MRERRSGSDISHWPGGVCAVEEDERAMLAGEVEVMKKRGLAERSRIHVLDDQRRVGRGPHVLRQFRRLDEFSA